MENINHNNEAILAKHSEVNQNLSGVTDSLKEMVFPPLIINLEKRRQR